MIRPTKPLKLNEKTIRQFIIDSSLKLQEERLEAFLKISGCPKVMISGTEKMISDYKAGKLTISGDKSLLDIEFDDFKVSKGNGGKTFITFDDKITYFPDAKYGKFITLKEEKK